MLHGRVVRPPVVNSEPIAIDESSVEDIPGMVRVVRQGSFVGVVPRRSGPPSRPPEHWR